MSSLYWPASPENIFFRVNSFSVRPPCIKSGDKIGYSKYKGKSANSAIVLGSISACSYIFEPEGQQKKSVC